MASENSAETYHLRNEAAEDIDSLRPFPPVRLNAPAGETEPAEADLAHYGLCMLAEYLASAGWEMTFNPAYRAETPPSPVEKFRQSAKKLYDAKKNGLSKAFAEKLRQLIEENYKPPSEESTAKAVPVKITFPSSEEALLRHHRLDDVKPLRQIHYKYLPPARWDSFGSYYMYVLYNLLKEDEYDAVARKIIDDVFDFAALNARNGNVNAHLRPLLGSGWIDEKCNIKYKAFLPAKYAANIDEIRTEDAAEHERYMEIMSQSSY